MERTSWLKNPDTGSLNRYCEQAGHSGRRPQGALLARYCTGADKQEKKVQTPGRLATLSKQTKIMNYLPSFGLETWILLITFVCLFVM